MSNPCQMTEPPFYQCCCNCKHRVMAMPKVNTEGEPGFACAVPMSMEGDPFRRMVFVNWPEHSCGCELYSPVNA